MNAICYKHALLGAGDFRREPTHGTHTSTTQAHGGKRRGLLGLLERFDHAHEASEANGEAIEPPGDSTASAGSSLASTNSNVLLLGFVVFALFFNAPRHV